MSQDYLEMAELFRILADPTRLKIVYAITSGSELCVGDLAKESGVSLSATSHQLKKMELVGIVSKCRYGKEICYCLNESSKAEIIRKLVAIKI